jgi:hypothetical protein
VGKWFDLPHGHFGPYDDNEVEAASYISDPVKFRGAVAADKVESNLVALSGNLRRNDGRHEEYGLLNLRLTSDKKAGAFNVDLRPHGSDKCREVFYIDEAGAQFRVPIIAPNLGGGSAGGRVTRFYSDDGQICFNCQGPSSGWPKGAILKYDTHQSTDESTWTAVGIIRGEAL